MTNINKLAKIFTVLTLANVPKIKATPNYIWNLGYNLGYHLSTRDINHLHKAYRDSTVEL